MYSFITFSEALFAINSLSRAFNLFADTNTVAGGNSTLESSTNSNFCKFFNGKNK